MEAQDARRSQTDASLAESLYLSGAISLANRASSASAAQKGKPTLNFWAIGKSRRVNRDAGRRRTNANKMYSPWCRPES